MNKTNKTDLESETDSLEDLNISSLVTTTPENFPSKCPNPNHQNEITIKEAGFCNVYPVDALQNCFHWEGQKQFLTSNPAM